MASYYRKLTAVLQAAGCRFSRQGKGDHEIWFSPVSNRHFVVDRSIKSRHTANGVLKEAGIEKHF